MISLNFGLWWSGAKLSYLRYLTFKTLRHFHPHSRIQLFTNDKYDLKSKGTGKVGIEEQEFVNPELIEKDYINKLSDLDVEIVKMSQFSKYSPNHQSDLFRWWYLLSHGGFYLDTDQIILRSFKDLPIKKYKFIYSSYKVDSPYAPNKYFSPVGVLGASTDSKIINIIAKSWPKYYNAKDYNCIGPWMFSDMEKKMDMKEGYNAPSYYFYPAAICDKMNSVFSGEMKLEKSFALHWFGGYGKSQKFNKNYTEEFAKKGTDSISKFLREKKLI